MLIASILIYFFISIILCAAVFERVNPARLILTFFILAYSSNVVIFEVLSLLGRVNQPATFFIAQLLLGVFVVFLSFKLGRLSIAEISAKYRTFLKGFTWPQWILLLFTAAVLGCFLFVGLTTPPNNLDTLHSHLSRIYYWFQHGSFAYWNATTSSHLNTPINSHIQGLWLFLLGKSENLFFLVQWFSLVAMLAAVYETARSLEFSPRQALFSTFIALSFPILLMQTYSYQGDLVTAALVMVGVCFLALCYRQFNLVLLLAAVLSLLLAVGTKQTALFVLPAAGIFILIILIRNRKLFKLLPILALSLLFVVLFTSYQYVQNQVNTGSIFGSDDVMGQKVVTFENIDEKTKYVLPRYLYQLIGVDGLPRFMQPSLIKMKADVFRAILTPAQVNLEDPVYLQPGFSTSEQFYYDALPVLSEDSSWFGPLVFPVLVFSILLTLFSRNQTRRGYCLFALLLSLSYVFLVFVQRPGWDPYQGRYFIIGLMPLLPLASILLPEHSKWRILPLVIVIPVTLFVAFNTYFTNISKPIINAATFNGIENRTILPLPEDNRYQLIFKNFAVRQLNRLAETANVNTPYKYLSYYRMLYTGSQIIADNIEFINTLIPANAPIYLSIQRNALEYGLFGVNKTRDLFPVDDISEVRSGYFITNSSVEVADSDRIELLGQNADYSIFFIEP